MKTAGSESTTGIAAPPMVDEVLRSPGEPLDAATRAFMEPRFGQGFGGVRVHTDSEAAESAQAVQASAYTVGQDVVFGPGEFDPHTAAGRRLLAHELAHVQQQSAGQIQRDVAQRQPDDPGTPAAVQQECPGYEPGELEKSKQDPGVLSSAVTQVASDKLLIADFGVDWRHVKDSVRADPLVHSWMAGLDPSAKLEIAGFSDCVGEEANNDFLRIGRARRVAALLEPALSSHPHTVEAAPRGSFVAGNLDRAGRAKNRGVTITAVASSPKPPQPTPPPKPAPPPTAAPWQVCFDGKSVVVNKNNLSAACNAITSSDAPTPEGMFCVRPQGEAQLADSIFHPFRPSRSNWYLLEPQFSTSRSRMDLHPGSISKGCITVTNMNCFQELEAVLNSGGTSTGYGYDGYPPGNDEKVNNPEKSVDCVAVLQVSYTGGCGNMSEELRATQFQQCLKEERVPVPAGAEAAEAAENELKMKCYQKTGYMFWTQSRPMVCTETGCSRAEGETQK